MSGDQEPAEVDWPQEVPWPFHALLAWSLVLVGSFVTVLVVAFLGEFRPHELWAVYVGDSNWIPAVYAPLAWWDAWRGHRVNALRGARMYLGLALAVGVVHLVTSAAWHGGALARPWPLLVSWAAPAALLIAFSTRSVTSWARPSGRAEPAGTR